MESGDTRKKKVSRRTILASLYDREINGMKTRMNCIRGTYQNVYPNCTVFYVETPDCYLRKFTPDGRHLIAFSEDRTSIDVYDYLGCAMAADLLKNYQVDRIVDYGDDHVCVRIFKTLFRLKHRIKIPTDKERLYKECILFTENGHALVASTTFKSNNRRPKFYDVHTNNESLRPNEFSPLNDYTIYLINLNSGAICSSIHFKCDKIHLCHNQGLYLFKNTLAILSVQHQVIHVYEIIQNRLCLQKSVGRFCIEDDQLLIASVYTVMKRSNHRPFREKSINGLKHKLLIFMYKKAEEEVLKTGSQNPLKHFYRNFNEFLSLRMWKMQLIEKNQILIRYSSEEIALLNIEEPNTVAGLFIIYNIDTTEVLNVFENTSSDLIEIFERYTDNFHNPCANPQGFIPSSPANNIHARQSYTTFKNTNFQFDDVMETNREVLSHLPIAAQSFTSTPYLDQSLFSYDEEWVSPMERPIPVAENPIRFFSRDSGILRFCLHNREPSMPAIDNFAAVSFIFHPTDPFVISLQIEKLGYFVNFHIRNVYMPE